MADDPTKSGDGRVHGASTVTPVGGGGGGGAPPPKGRPKWLIWLLPLLGLLLLLLLLQTCSDRDEIELPVAPTPAPAAAPATAAAPAQVAPAPVAVNDELSAYLASAEPAGRRFTFDNINFATNSAEIPQAALQNLTTLAALMTQYPNVRVRVEGYADARGGEGTNAQLGAQRAEAVARTLISQGVAADRITAATGSETNPVAPNSTAQGQAQNRRTDLVVVQK